MQLRWKQLNMLYKLLLINIGVFLILILLKLILFLFGQGFIYNQIIGFLALPSSIHGFLTHFWTLITYMFLHESFMHILANMLWLYFMGILFLQYFNDRQMLNLYFLSGIVGGLLFILFYNVFPVFRPFRNSSILLGASAAISGIVIGICAYKPKQEVYLFGILRIPLWLIGVLYVLYDLAMISSSNPGGHISHLGGALVGLIFGIKAQHSVDITAWMNFSRSKPKMKVHKHYGNVRDDYRPKDYEWNKKQQDIKAEIDRILDKISRYGYNSLTRKEKEFLRQHTRDYN